MTNDTTNRLILSIAHRPLPTELLDSLIEKTATKSKQLLAELEATTETDGIPEDSTSRPSRNLHVLVTGSPKITTPGKSFDDWETKWTPGENIFSNFIDQVGLQRFHRLPRDGEARLVGKLVDVKQNDFQVHLEDGTVKEQLRNELVWIAINVKQHFNLYASAPVIDAIILYPFDVEGEDNYADADTDDGMGRDMIASTIHDIFQKEWAEKEGPLNGVQISIQIVNP